MSGGAGPTKLFGQTFEPHDLIVVGILVVLEGVLSIDNALVLGLLAKRLPRFLQGRALTYGLVGAFVFRLMAIATASYLLHWRFAKLIGGLYLVYVAAKHFVWDKEGAGESVQLDARGRPVIEGEELSTAVPPEPEDPLLSTPEAAEHRHHLHLPRADVAHAASTHTYAFWMAVLAIELTDIAFAIDSIVAAIGVVGPPPPGARHPKLWVVLVGGMLGVVLMRFAAVVFIRLLEKFPRFETSAYLLVIVIGGKLVVDYLFNTDANPHRVDFHSPDTWAFWAFWMLMLACFLIGFIPQRKGTDQT